MKSLPRADRYKILASSVTPRPIAWVSSVSAAGDVNVAPYSFFNVMGDDPPILALGLLRQNDGSPKDTAANVRDTGEFVVNLVSENDAVAMNVTCMNAPPDVDESACAGVQMTSCSAIIPPRIASAPVSFECRCLHYMETGADQLMIVGEVLVAHIQDHFLIDADRLYIDAPRMHLIARMHGSGWYSRQTDIFHLERPSYSHWLGAGTENGREPVGEIPSDLGRTGVTSKR